MEFKFVQISSSKESTPLHRNWAENISKFALNKSGCKKYFAPNDKTLLNLAIFFPSPSEGVWSSKKILEFLR